MDGDGIAIAVLYATSALFFGPLDPIEALRDVEFVAACQRAYNDWLSEYCRAHPDRLFGMAAVPLQDVDLAVAEAERAIGQLGLKGVFIRPSAYLGELPLNHRAYDRFWAACQDLDVPVSLHPAVHTDTAGACRKFGLVREHPNLSVTNGAIDDEHGGSALGQAVGNTVDMIVSLGRLLMGGVCERFPRLRLIFLESGGGWCPTQLERMDEQVEAYSAEGRALSVLPSEYFRRQCYISFDPGEWNLAASARHIGADRILWASDYPHPEYRAGIVAELMASLEALPEADQRRIAPWTSTTRLRRRSSDTSSGPGWTPT
jgi:predicted TIM-barrel fold metal-dependent hydrolase